MHQMNYTRKRALLACDFCRHRKRKCDGGKPCSTCVESNADCVYKELPSDRVESTSPGAVLERLSRIEVLMEEQIQRMSELSLSMAPGVATPRTSLASTLQPYSFVLPPFDLSHAPATSPAPRAGKAPEQRMDVDQHFLIPHRHTSSTDSLLSSCAVRDLVGEYPSDYFHDIEARLPLPPSLDLAKGRPEDWPPLDLDILSSLADGYFSWVHPHFPLFHSRDFEQWQALLFRDGLQDNPETAICLCVYALSCLVSDDGSTVGPGLQGEKDGLALRFFAPALRIVLQDMFWGFSPSIRTCQAIILCGIYFAHLGRPLHSWKAIYCASLRFIQLLDKRRDEQLRVTDLDDNSLRLFWSCFMIECDRTAEMEVARSGIEPLADGMPLPRSIEPEENDTIIYFAAETAIRRLLNRIHSSLYRPQGTEHDASAASLNLNQLLALGSELDRQLEEWYHSIPGKIRPPMGTMHIANDRGKALRLRYYAAKHFIHRPFLLLAVQDQFDAQSGQSTPASSLPFPPGKRVVQEKAEFCIASCRSYLYNVAELLDKRSPYLWTMSQSSLACLLVLRVAESSSHLRHFAPDVDHLRQLITDKLQRWATPGSSFEAAVGVLENMSA